MNLNISAIFLRVRHLLPVAIISVAAVWTTVVVSDLGYVVRQHVLMIFLHTTITLFFMGLVHAMLRRLDEVGAMAETIIVSAGMCIQIANLAAFESMVSMPVSSKMAGLSVQMGADGPHVAEVVDSILAYGEFYLTVCAFAGILSFLLSLGTVRIREKADDRPIEAMATVDRR